MVLNSNPNGKGYWPPETRSDEEKSQEAERYDKNFQELSKIYGGDLPSKVFLAFEGACPQCLSWEGDPLTITRIGGIPRFHRDRPFDAPGAQVDTWNESPDPGEIGEVEFTCSICKKKTSVFALPNGDWD